MIVDCKNSSVVTCPLSLFHTILPHHLTSAHPFIPFRISRLQSRHDISPGKRMGGGRSRHRTPSYPCVPLGASVRSTLVLVLALARRPVVRHMMFGGLVCSRCRDLKGAHFHLQPLCMHDMQEVLAWSRMPSGFRDGTALIGKHSFLNAPR